MAAPMADRQRQLYYVPAMSLPELILRKNEDRRLRAGHLWVFSNEVDNDQTPLTAFTPGQAVVIAAHNGQRLGSGYVNPHSLICARLVSRNSAHPYGAALVRERIAAALRLRDRLFDQPYYRLVYGESDGLPGLVVDRYGDVLVAQLNTAGTEAMKGVIVDALGELLTPAGILLRNDGASRELEGLPAYVETAAGTVPDSVLLFEHGCTFRVPLTAGQKTGWFFDHAQNRRLLQRHVRGRRVLDVFSYLGAWGIQAAVNGATEVVCADSSEPALANIAENARLNEVEDHVRTVAGDAFGILRDLRHQNERFDVVILDPPAFIKRRKDLAKGSEAYRRLNHLAMQVLADDGTLITASCSSHLPATDFRDLVRQAAVQAGRFAQIIEQGHQAPDHPVHPAIPETEYLKTLVLRLTASL
jgi:23S rRNA (cytosine1962-C5)-methyltransferase